MKYDILLLEDQEVRLEWLVEKFPTVTIKHVLTKGDFIYNLRHHRFKLIIMDHDLGLPDFNGYRAALYMASTFENLELESVLIWTQNPVGKDNMKSVLGISSACKRIYSAMFGLESQRIIDIVMKEVL